MTQFSHIAKALHWLVASLIVTQYVLAELAENAEHENNVLEQLALLANHKSVGITILALAVIRLAYRLYSPAPKLPASMSGWQVAASKVSHVLLYGFLFAMPLSGWLMSSAKAYSVSWFNLIALPDFVAPNEAFAELMHTMHHYLAEALFVVAAIHVLAALKHQFIDKDDVLSRITSKRYWVLFAVLTLIFVSLLGRFLTPDSRPSSGSNVVPSAVSQASPNVSVEPETNADTALRSETVDSDLPLWNIDYQQSSIKFIGDQAGAPFEGEWQQWTAEMQFDDAHLEKSRFNVAIDLSSGFTNDQERDDTIRSSDFFDVDLFPQAYFFTDTFSNKGGSFQSVGELSMKGISADATLNFTVTEVDGIKVLTGSAPLNRFEWEIGMNDWADTTWVGQNVMVQVHVVTMP